MSRYTFLFVCIAVSSLISLCSVAGTIDVGLGGGYSFSTIQDGINAAMTGDTVLVYPGIYSGDGNRNLNFNGKDIKLVSVSGRENTIIDVGTGYRGFYLNSGETRTAVIDGFTVRNADYGGYGAGMFCNNSSPTVQNCTFNNNCASGDVKGGGIYFGGNSSAAVVGTIFTYNESRHGGGIGIYSSGTLDITGCYFANNDARYAGGGIWSHDGTQAIDSCVFKSNTGDYGGGGIRLNECDSSVTNSIFYDNYGPNGAAIRFDTGNFLVQQCTVTGNRLGDEWGGGIFTATPTHVTVLNSILWGNDGEEIYLYADNPYDPVVQYSDIEDGWLGTGNINADPLFVNASLGNFRLGNLSQCIDAGMELSVYVDIDENIRPYDMPGVDNNGPLADFDMGAYEAVPEPSSMLILLLGGLAAVAGKIRRRA